MPLGIVATVQKYCTNKCHNIFTKHLFLIVVDHIDISIIMKNYKICCVSITIYIKKKYKQKNKKNATTVATVPLGTVATVQNLNKRLKKRLTKLVLDRKSVV